MAMRQNSRPRRSQVGSHKSGSTYLTAIALAGMMLRAKAFGGAFQLRCMNDFELFGMAEMGSRPSFAAHCTNDRSADKQDASQVPQKELKSPVGKIIPPRPPLARGRATRLPLGFRCPSRQPCDLGRYPCRCVDQGLRRAQRLTNVRRPCASRRCR